MRKVRLDRPVHNRRADRTRSVSSSKTSNVDNEIAEGTDAATKRRPPTTTSSNKFFYSSLSHLLANLLKTFVYSSTDFTWRKLLVILLRGSLNNQTRKQLGQLKENLHFHSKFFLHRRLFSCSDVKWGRVFLEQKRSLLSDWLTIEKLAGRRSSSVPFALLQLIPTRIRRRAAG